MFCPFRTLYKFIKSPGAIKCEVFLSKRKKLCVLGGLSNTSSQEALEDIGHMGKTLGILHSVLGIYNAYNIHRHSKTLKF